MLRCPGGEQTFRDGGVPAAQDAAGNQLEIRKKSSVCHVFRVEVMFCRKNYRTIEGVQMPTGDTVEDRFFASEGDGCGARDSGAAREVGDRMFRQFGTRAYKAHVAGKHIQKLGQFIQFPAAQKRTYRSEALIPGGGDWTMGFVRSVDHGPEFQDGEAPAVTAFALLKEEDRPG